MIRFTILSDLHAHPWTAFSRGDGLSNSRLQRSLEVLETSLKRAQDEEIPWVFAGDLVHTAGFALNVVMTGLVDVLRKYPEVPKFANWGNHDARGKGGKISLEQTVFASIQQAVENLTILEDGEVHELADGITIAGAGFQPRPDLVEYGDGADIGVFHQTVRNSTSPSGYELTEGIEADELLSRFRFSIVGHVHHPQQFDAPQGSAVLIPGSPEHHNFGDKGDHGWWVATYHEDGRKNPEVEFVDGGSPKFLTVDSPSEIQDDGNFYRVRSMPAGADLPENATAISPEPTVVSERDILQGVSEVDQILQAWMRHSEPDENMGRQNLLQIGRQLLSAQDPVQMRPARLKKLRLRNFMSYEDQEFEIPEGLHLIIGTGRDYESNGAGKTTLVGESLYWLLFDENTKGMAADEVIRRGESRCSVSGVIEEPDGSIIEVERGRTPSGPYLNVNHDGEEWEASGSVAMTKKLNRFLGLTPEIARNLGYFSQEDLILFSSATDGERKSVLSDLIGLSAYQQASSAANSEASERESEMDKKAAVLEDYTETIKAAKQKALETRKSADAWEDRRAERAKGVLDKITSIQDEDRISWLQNRLAKIEQRAADLVDAYDNRLSEQVEERIEERHAELAEQLKHRLAEIEQEQQEQEEALSQDFGSVEQARSGVAGLAKVQSTYEQAKEQVQECSDVFNEATQHKASVLAEKQAVERELESAQSEWERTERSLQSGICPTCQQEITDEHRVKCLQPINMKLAEIQERLNQTTEEALRTDEAVQVKSENLDKARDRKGKLEAMIELLKEGRRGLDRLDELDRQYEEAEKQIGSLRSVAERQVHTEVNEAVREYEIGKERLVQRARDFVRQQADEIRNEIRVLESKLEGIRAEENPHERDAHSAKARQSAAEEKVSDLRSEISQLRHEIALYSYWTKGFSKQGIQSLLLEEISSLFNKNRGDIFPILTQGVYDVQFSTLSETRAGELREKTEFIVHEHGTQIPYGSLSGGQRRRVDLGIMLVLAFSIAEWMDVPGILGVLVLDEVTSFLDSSGAEGLLDALYQVQERIPTIFTITHDPGLQSMFPEVIRVEQDEAGVSRIVA